MTERFNPFVASAAVDAADADLARLAASGDRAALEQLIRRHQKWIYNLALRFMLNPDDAADLSQEAMIRIVTRIGQFEGRSSFRTWAYRIVANCFTDSKRGRLEHVIVSFDAYGADLDALPLQTLDLPAQYEPERALIIEEAKNGCMLGMLLCLSRVQRLAYILGEIFETPSEVAADILDITPSAFRKRLQRARDDLVAFMNDKCGLINRANPCRCGKKTRAFLDAGWLDPDNVKFASQTLLRIKEQLPKASRQLNRLVDEQYAELFRDHPAYEGTDLAEKLARMLEDEATRSTFDLDGG
jgi:RNA polymerase sigma factor (sigma-70 family)